MLRRLAVSAGVVAIVVVLGLAGVVAAPADAANALAPAPAPLDLPASALDPGVMTSAQWNTWLQGHPELIPTQVKGTAAIAKVGIASVGAPVATAASGLLVGTQIGTGLAQTFGLPTTGSFFCDLGQLLGNCGAGPAPTYTPDSDLTPTPPGWGAGQNAFPMDNSGYIGSTWTVVRGVAQYAVADTGSVTAGGVATVNIARISGNPSLNYFQTYVATVVDSVPAAKCNGTTGGGVSSGSIALGRVTTYTYPAGCVWHLDVRDPDTAGNPVVGSWYPVGHASRPPDFDAHPARTWRTTWTCSSGPGGSATSAAFHEGDTSWPAIPQPSCSAGSVSTMTVSEVAGTTSTTMYTWTAPTGPAAVVAAHPQCASGPCELLLFRISGGQAVSCFDNVGVCNGWWDSMTDAQRSTVVSKPAAGWGTFDGYECTYGGDPVAITDCAMYRPTFDPTNTTTKYAGPDGGLPPADPGGGGGGGGSDPNDDPNCPPPFTGLSLFNPWWYYQGALCAGKKLFVPGAATFAAMAGLGTAVGASAIGVAQPAWDGLTHLGMPSDSACGVIVDTQPSQFGGQHLTINTCDEPWSSVGPPLRNLLGIGCILSAVWTCITLLLSAVGADIGKAAREAGRS